ncbi:MAG: tetratricopeptide repeat protein [Maricaulaceae bacterium]|jgi:hypothetical protein
MADIFDEVEEGLRHDRYRRLFRQYGPLGAAIVVAVVLGVAGWELLSAMRERAGSRSSEAYLAAIEMAAAQNFEGAAAAFSDLADSGSGAYPTLARMQEAALAVQSGELSEAARLYEQAAAQTSDPFLEDAARLNAAYLLAEEISLDDLEVRLAPLMEPSAPFEPLARELLGATALRAGDYERARSAYNTLSVAIGAPQGVQRRAAQALAAIDAAEASLQSEDD